MESSILVAIVSVVAILIGIFLGKQIFAKNTQKQIQDAELQARKITEDAEKLGDALKEKKILEAKESFLQKKSEHDREVSRREQEINKREQKIAGEESRIKQKEQQINDKNAGLQKQINEYTQLKQNLDKQLEVVNIKRTELERHQEDHIKRLEKVANLSADEA